MRKRVAYMILILASLLSACQDDEELKIPTEFGFRMDMNRNASTNGRLSFSQGSITLAAFGFDGRREEGGDVSFTQTYDQGLNLVFDPNRPVEALKFQIPQGDYYHIEVELDTYDDEQDGGLVLLGSYLNTSGVRYPLRFELGSALEFETVVKESSGNTQIVLKKERPVTALIKIDPIKWFDVVPATYLDHASLLIEEGETEGEVKAGSPYILINEGTNTNIYEIILSRIAQSAEVVIQ